MVSHQKSQEKGCSVATALKCDWENYQHSSLYTQWKESSVKNTK